MTLTITIQCDNAAFNETETGPSWEVTKILKYQIIDRFGGRNLADMHGLPLFDTNGNRVGKVEVQA